MQLHSGNWGRDRFLRIVSRIYRISLCLYPKSFHKRFGAEMYDVFQEALIEHTRKGCLHTSLFLGRELIEAPMNILNQHFAVDSFWKQPYPINILTFTFGFTLLGISTVLNFYQTLNGFQVYLLTLFCYLLVGGLGGTAIGTGHDPRKKKLFAFCGAIGSLLANTLGTQLTLQFFPDAFTPTGNGITFLSPFLHPILSGSIFGLFLGLANGNWHGVFRYIGIGCLAQFTGFFVNRLCDALMQSYLFHNSFQGINQTSSKSLFIIYLLLPYLLEGLSIGILYGGITQRSIPVKTTYQEKLS